jgi:hypothetical protein
MIPRISTVSFEAALADSGMSTVNLETAPGPESCVGQARVLFASTVPPRFWFHFHVSAFGAEMKTRQMLPSYTRLTQKPGIVNTLRIT